MFVEVQIQFFTNLQLEFELSGSTICWSAFSVTSNGSEWIPVDTPDDDDDDDDGQGELVVGPTQKSSSALCYSWQVLSSCKITTLEKKKESLSPACFR